ncbi:MAG: TonB family protein [Mariprofundaceae bacterium]|nr:TonB family protein [Mariprofundaceae bacterium]
MLETRDLLFAFSLHVLVVLSIIGMNQWRVAPMLEPERTIAVNMVSLEDFLRLQQPKVIIKEKVLKAIVTPKKQPKPVLKAKKTVKKSRVNEEELDFDPFAPMESSQNQPRQKKISGKKALAAMLQAQLGEQEVTRYILAMQRAVEQQWKVPTEVMGRVQDALVLLTLFRNGKVANIEIVESSGSVRLDETLKQAIYAAAPFVLPEQQFELFKQNTIRFKPLK